MKVKRPFMLCIFAVHSPWFKPWAMIWKTSIGYDARMSYDAPMGFKSRTGQTAIYELYYRRA